MEQHGVSKNGVLESGVPENVSLQTIADALCKAENLWLQKICGSCSITSEACMPKEITPNDELKFLPKGAFTFLVGEGGLCKGIRFRIGDKFYNYAGSLDNTAAQRDVFKNFGFIHVSSATLKAQKKADDRSRPLEIDGPVITIQPSATMNPFTYRIVERPKYSQDGLVFIGNDGIYHFLPGSKQRPVITAAVRQLHAHGYDPFEEKK